MVTIAVAANTGLFARVRAAYVKSVSYTHLDVYKRQILRVMRCSFLSDGKAICSRNVACSGCNGCILKSSEAGISINQGGSRLPSFHSRQSAVHAAVRGRTSFSI